ncbi:trypsin delta-like [Schistocerca nitens]|uniref:trypsin delta-like n=1 Tax=Schistocerca nitens TaxID=7011 RepID=UPI0021196D7B|nr:trypsin delta-like [Schistocerca nitens]
MKLLAIFLLCLLGSAAALASSVRLWNKAAGRIIGGTSITIESYPWQLSLHYSGSYICGASIISCNWALTAAQCVDGLSVSLISLRAGSATRESGGCVLSASSASIHDGYNGGTKDYDIALVLVLGSLLGTYVRPAGLPPDGFDSEEGLSVTVTGWGDRPTSGLEAVNLGKVYTSILARRTCQDVFAGFNAVTERMVCPGAASESVCRGDYGGPLVSGATQMGTALRGHARRLHQQDEIDDSLSSDEDENDVEGVASNPAAVPYPKDSEWTAVDTYRPLPVNTTPRQILVDIDESSSVLDCSKVFLTDSDVNELKRQTNLYASQTIQKKRRGNNLKPHSVLSSWKPVTIKTAHNRYFEGGANVCHKWALKQFNGEI